MLVLLIILDKPLHPKYQVLVYVKVTRKQLESVAMQRRDKAARALFLKISEKTQSRNEF